MEGGVGANFHILSLIENFDFSNLSLDLPPDNPLPHSQELGLLMENFGPAVHHNVRLVVIFELITERTSQPYV